MRSVQQCKCASVTFRRPIEPKRSSLHSAECGRAETRVARMRAEYINQLDYSRSVFNFTTEAHHAWDDIVQERQRNERLQGGCVDAASSPVGFGRRSNQEESEDVTHAQCLQLKVYKCRTAGWVVSQ